MQFASPTRNNNIRDCQKTSNYKVRSHFTFYSPSINLTFLKINMKLKHLLLHRKTGWTVATEQKRDSPTLKNWMDTEWRMEFKHQTALFKTT